MTVPVTPDHRDTEPGYGLDLTGVCRRRDAYRDAIVLLLRAGEPNSDRADEYPAALDAYTAAAQESAQDVPELVTAVQNLRSRLDAAHDALTRITEADGDAFTTLESTVEYVVSGWRGMAAAEEAAGDEAERLRERVAAVESLCRSYTPEPPPIFRGPGLSEFGKGNNHGMRTLANAVLGALRGEESDDDACCAGCKTGGGNG